MSYNKQRLIKIVVLMIVAILTTSCKVPISQSPANTPTLIPTGLFVSPFPSVENPMAMIQQFAAQTQTAAAALGTPGTPGTPSTVTTPRTATAATVNLTPGTPTNVIATTPVPATVTPGGPTATLIPSGSRPSSYTLQKGEFPYCIARRFNVNPDELLSINGLSASAASNLPPGTSLKIPQTSNPFPASRALHAHPDTYTVASSEETVYGVACYYGDVDPAQIAQLNGISVSSNLSVGQQLKIP